MTRKKMYDTDKPNYEAVKAYREARNIVRVPLDMPNEEAAALRQYCADHGLTVAGFIRELVRNAIAAAADPVQPLPGGESGGAVPGEVTASHSRE